MSLLVGLYALLPFNLGWELALAHLGAALLCAVTVIGIPFAVAHVKLAILALWSFGKEIV